MKAQGTEIESFPIYCPNCESSEIILSNWGVEFFIDQSEALLMEAECQACGHTFQMFCTAPQHKPPTPP